MQKRGRNSQEVAKIFARLEREGGVCISDSRVRELIVVRAEPAMPTIYEFRVVIPSLSIIQVKNLHDPDFVKSQECRFRGSALDGGPFEEWEKIPFRVKDYLHKDCYPVIEMQGRVVVLPKVTEIYLGGRPLFGGNLTGIG